MNPTKFVHKNNLFAGDLHKNIQTSRYRPFGKFVARLFGQRSHKEIRCLPIHSMTGNDFVCLINDQNGRGEWIQEGKMLENLAITHADSRKAKLHISRTDCHASGHTLGRSRKQKVFVVNAVAARVESRFVE
jgi:hypothetical protein